MHEDDASKNEPLIEILSPRYMPLEKISSGGMGLVYKAYDETLGKTVAIKMNILDSAEPEMVLRFQQEARAVSRLNHPNIIGVMDFGLLGDNQPYLVMEFAEGESLQQKLKGKGRFEAHEVIEILCQICDGMTHAHERGVIHRDLKPGNLMLEEDSEGRLHVRILDFGIARIERNQEEKGFSTRSGALIGSPLYMSPEQIRCLEIDQRSDVYSLGCIAYEMLSGRPPFEETSYVLTFKAHLEKASQPLPEDGPEDLLAGALNQVVLKCLSKSKEQRYESMLGLKEALLACKAQSIAAEPVDQNQASLKSGGSNRKLILVFSAVALVAFVCFSIFFNDRDRRPADDMIVTGDTKLNSIGAEVEEPGSKRFEVVRENNLAKWTAIADPYRPVGDADLGLIKGDNVVAVDLEHAIVTAAGLKVLLDFPLQRLTLGGPSIGDEAIRLIRQITSLRALDLINTAITDRSFRELGNLNLYGISVRSSKKVTDRGLVEIARIWPDLRDLDLSGSSVSPSGLVMLDKFEHLQVLILESLTISDESMATICKLPLRTLNLTDTKISAEAISMVGEMKTLESLLITRCSAANMDVKRELEEAIPGCTVTYFGFDKSESGKLQEYTDLLGK